MANKTFTEKQREIIARKLGYNGPMSQFDKFVRSSPAMEQKVKQLAVKLVAKGGFIKKFAQGGLSTAEAEALVNKIYGDILGRAPDTAGKDFYAEKLASGELDPAKFQAQVADSPEGKAKVQADVAKFVTERDAAKFVAATAAGESTAGIGRPLDISQIAAGFTAPTPEIAKDLMIKSMTTGVSSSEFDKYGGREAVKSVYEAQGGGYDPYKEASASQLQELAQTVAQTGVGDLEILKKTNTPLTAAGVANMVKNGIDPTAINKLAEQGIPFAESDGADTVVGGGSWWWE
jgi:hypothetical protein